MGGTTEHGRRQSTFGGSQSQPTGVSSSAIAEGMAKKSRKKSAERAANAADEYSCPIEGDIKPTAPQPVKKKLITKLSRKQKLRKALKQKRGEDSVSRAEAKSERHSKKLDKRLWAKNLW